MIMEILLYIAGICEDFTAMLLYKFAQKGHKPMCFILQMIRCYIWFYVLKTLFNNNGYTFLLVSCYAFGCGCGSVLGLFIEQFIEKTVVKLIPKRGRKKKWLKWLWFKKRKFK